MNDATLVIARYAIFGLLAYLGGKGVIPKESVQGFGDQIMNAIPLIGAAATALWGIWVRWNTRSVPIATALRADVPTVNPATGATEPGRSFTAT